MKSGVLFAAAVLCLNVCGFVGCRTAASEDTGRKITNYQEYTLTVASEMLPGVFTSCGSSVLADVYAVKEEGAQEWTYLQYIGNFDYESGYEYRIRIGRTSYLDFSMGEPAWTEYKLLEIISKERKDSEGLPESFVPEWFDERAVD